MLSRGQLRQRHGAARTRAARGLSLIELMVGITIGLIVVAGATLLAATQLSDNRRLLLETQVQQDLRAAADIVTREVRRGGFITWANATIWSSATPSDLASPNPLSKAVYNVGGEKVAYGYHRPGSGADNSLFFGFRLTSGAIQQRIGASVQDLTDRGTLEVTDFQVLQIPVAASQLACPKLCADGTQNCWPTVTISDVQVTIKGKPKNNPEQVERTVTSRVRMRNEGIQLGSGATQVCPS